MFLAVDISTHGDVGQTITVPDDAFLETVFQRRHLRQGHTATIVGRHRQARQIGKLGTLLLGTTQEDLDQLVVFTELTDR
ncbi:hypothetical protein D3C75_1247670 [compost metagenome]